MAELTGISWADSTANLWMGCQKVSEACDHCYAEDLMGTEGSRLKRVQWGPDGERLRVKQGWSDVRKWNARAAANGGQDPDLGRRRRIFVNSLSDFFDNHRSVVWRDEAWDLIRASPDVIFMLVTKRPQLIARYLPPFWDQIAERVWLLTTVETQEWADRRVPELLASCSGKAKPAVFGLSVEPMLGPVDLAKIYDMRTPKGHTDQERWGIKPLAGRYGIIMLGAGGEGDWLDGNGNPAAKIGWVIVGGESGKEARPMHPRWVRDLRDQCAAAGVPFHFKQWGEWGPATGAQEGDVIFRDPHPEFPGNDVVSIGTTVRRVGKKAAGRRLVGVEHLGFPDAG